MPKQPGQGGQPESMLQGLQVVLGALGSMMAAPDADIQFLTQLQHAIVGKIKQGTQAANQPGAGQGQQIAPGGGAGMSGFGGVMGGPGGPGTGGPPPGMGGAPPPGMAAPGPGGVGTPNPDELRRVLGANAQAA